MTVAEYTNAMDLSSRTFGIDLEPIPASQASIPFTDLIIRRGFGAFDFLRVIDGVPLFIHDHLARFERTAEMLELEPRPTTEALTQHVREIIALNGVGNYGIQLFLTGGDPTDNFTPSTPRTLVLVDNLAPYPAEQYKNGVTLLKFEFARDLPAAKTTNYFTAVRHARTLRDANASDMLYHQGGRVLETTRSNLFIVQRDGTLRTPRDGILWGITRQQALKAFEGHLDVKEGETTLAQLEDAAEVFLTSTTKGIMPIVRIDDHVVGDGIPGPITKQAMALFDAHRESWLTEHGPDWRAA